MIFWNKKKLPTIAKIFHSKHSKPNKFLIDCDVKSKLYRSRNLIKGNDNSLLKNGA